MLNAAGQYKVSRGQKESEIYLTIHLLVSSYVASVFHCYKQFWSENPSKCFLVFMRKKFSKMHT